MICSDVDEELSQRCNEPAGEVPRDDPRRPDVSS
jgi:hypothetical protein